MVDQATEWVKVCHWSWARVVSATATIQVAGSQNSSAILSKRSDEAEWKTLPVNLTTACSRTSPTYKFVSICIFSLSKRDLPAANRACCWSVGVNQALWSCCCFLIKDSIELSWRIYMEDLHFQLYRRLALAYSSQRPSLFVEQCKLARADKMLIKRFCPQNVCKFSRLNRFPY